MKSNILDIEGKKKGTIDLPVCFDQTVREDLIAKVLESKKIKQPYSPSPVAGQQASASGIIQHRRKVWKTAYGKGISRIPRKIMSRRGSQFNWVGATVPNTRGGRRAHPPKVVSMINTLKINKKEMKMALMSALSATINAKNVIKRYLSLKDKKVEGLPFIVESRFISLKTKESLSSLKKILGDLYPLAIQKKTIRSGKGTRRGRKYKNNAGLLLVLGNDEKYKTTAFDVINVKTLSVNHLAEGVPGRLTLYTENAIKDLGEKFK